MDPSGSGSSLAGCRSVRRTWIAPAAPVAVPVTGVRPITASLVSGSGSLASGSPGDVCPPAHSNRARSEPCRVGSASMLGMAGLLARYTKAVVWQDLQPLDRNVVAAPFADAVGAVGHPLEGLDGVGQDLK